MPTGTVHITVTASGEASHRGAEPADFSVDLPLELTPSTMTLTAETTPTPHGPAVVSETPLTGPATERGQSETMDPRSGLLAALLLAIAATVVFWPTTEDPANTEPTTRLQALTIQLPTTTPRVKVAHRGDLQTIATTTARPIIIGDGWEGTLTADALYWHDTTTPEPASPLKPDHHLCAEAHAHVPLAPRMSDAN